MNFKQIQKTRSKMKMMFALVLIYTPIALWQCFDLGINKIVAFLPLCWALLVFGAFGVYKMWKGENVPPIMYAKISKN